MTLVKASSSINKLLSAEWVGPFAANELMGVGVATFNDEALVFERVVPFWEEEGGEVILRGGTLVMVVSSSKGFNGVPKR